ncbi:hypothetical protein JOM56_001102 [Amanita muscaria]
MSLLRFSLLSSPSRSKKRDPSPSPDTNPRPSKTPRLSPSAANKQSMSTRLRRTDSHLSLSALCAPPAINPPPPVPLPPVTTTTAVPMPQPSASFTNTPASSSSSSSSPIPYTRTLWYYKEQRQKSKALVHSGAPEQDPLFLYFANALLSHQSKEQQQQPQQVQPSVLPLTPIGSSSRGIRITQNTNFKAPQQQFPAKSKKTKQRKAIPRFRPAFVPVSSPLVPRPHTSSSLYNMRPAFADDSRPMVPRARRAPDLYRFAIKACMRQSQQGQQLLSFGPRLACKLGDATQELENIVALESGQPLQPLQTSTQKLPSRPLRPLVRTESYADLSIFIQSPNPVPAAAAPAQIRTHDVRMAIVHGEDDCSSDHEDFEMFDLTS